MIEPYKCEKVVSEVQFCDGGQSMVGLESEGSAGLVAGKKKINPTPEVEKVGSQEVCDYNGRVVPGQCQTGRFVDEKSLSKKKETDVCKINGFLKESPQKRSGFHKIDDASQKPKLQNGRF